MSYYSELKKLIAVGHDPDTSPTVAALRSLHGGDRTVSLSSGSIRNVATRKSDHGNSHDKQIAYHEKRAEESQDYADWILSLGEDHPTD